MRRIVLSALVPVALLAMSAAALPSGADGQVCPPLDTGKIDTSGEPATITVTAPEGYAIRTVCIKAGSIHQGNGPELYTAGPEATSLTLGHSSGKAVSHWSADFVPLAEPTPPTDDPTPPTDDPTLPADDPTLPAEDPQPSPPPQDESQPVVTPPAEDPADGPAESPAEAGDVDPGPAEVATFTEPVTPQAPAPQAPSAVPVVQAPRLAG